MLFFIAFCLAVLIFDMLGNFALRSKEAKHMLIKDQHQQCQATDHKMLIRCLSLMREAGC